jgi:hypothetical protein
MLTLAGISKSYGDRVLFADPTLAGESPRRNWAGRSEWRREVHALFHHLGQSEPDDSEVIRMGYPRKACSKQGR